MISHNQALMLAMFEKGWCFRLYNDKPGSWTTYWSLVRRKLICNRKTIEQAGKPVVRAQLSEAGKRELKKHRGRE